MWNDDDRKWLYEQMRKNGVNTGSYDDFSKSLDNKEDRDWYYQKSRSLGLNVGSADDFASMMVQPVQKPAPAPAPAQPVVKQTTGQVNPTVNTSTQPKQDEQPQKQGGWQPTWQQRMGAQMMLDNMNQQMKQSQQDFSTRMENIRKGNTLGKTSEVKFNPESGKMERRYYTTHGDEVTTPLEQSRLNLKYRDEWEATTEEGRRHREKRIENDFERRVGSVMDKYDPDNATEIVWQRAEDKASEEMMAYLKDRQKPTLSNALHDMANASNVTGGVGMDNIEVGIKAFATHLKYHDLQRMADDAWNMLGKEKQQSIIEDMYGALKNRYPQATEQQLQQAATEMAREQSDRRMYELAVAKNAPKDAAEYFIRKVAAGNAMGTLMQAAARAQAGTTGDWEAREDAEQRFEKQGHKVAGIAGTVTGFALDPLTWASAGAGGGAVKGATWLGGRWLGQAATREFATSLGGRMAMGSLGGAVNLGTYEAGSEALDQLKWGGHRDLETGEVGDYSFGAVAGQFGHGAMMGSVTGLVAPFLGNVSDKMVRATESTAGKLGIRTGEIAVGTLAEGTIFSVPEWIDGSRDAMDVWTDNMAMMAGFRLQHAIKSAPRHIMELSSSKNGKAGFETRLRDILNGRPDLTLTDDERAELKEGGYTDLTDLTEDYQRYMQQQERKKGERQMDAARQIADILPENVTRDLPYNRFVELMGDKNISEAARAKMYYYLTGNLLPMSTVMGSSIIEVQDADGKVIGYNVQSNGANGVITSRRFKDKARAEVEVNRINRQAELNSIEVGERYVDSKGDNRRMREACDAVAEEVGAPANLLFELMKRKPEQMGEVELQWVDKVTKAYEGLKEKYGSSELRKDINTQLGVDVDKAIGKERNRRSEQEQKAVDEYANRLFADVKRKQEEAEAEAEERGEEPVNPNTPPTNKLLESLVSDDEGPAAEMNPSFRRGYEAGTQERRDIAMELAADDPSSTSYADRQEAWNGVVQRINEEADYLVAQQREQAKQIQHTDGSFHFATLKEKGEDGEGKHVYIVDGTVNMTADGTMVDHETSDNSVVVVDFATGERRMIDPTADTGISSVDEVQSAADFDAGIERYRQQYIQQQLDEAQGVVRVEPGQQITLPTGEEAVVMAIDGTGDGITVRLADDTQAQVSRADLQRAADDAALADYRQRHGITDEQVVTQEAEPENATGISVDDGAIVAGAPVDYTPYMEITVRDEDGTERTGMVMGRVRAVMKNGRMDYILDESSNIIEYLLDGEPRHEHIDKLNDKVLGYVEPRQPETGNTAAENIPAENNSEGENIPQTPVAEEQPAAQPPVETPAAAVEGATGEATAQPAEEVQQPAADAMPMVGEGDDAEPDFMHTTPQRGHQFIYDEAGLSRDEANQFVANNVEAANKALDKVKQKPPKMGTSIARFNKDKAAWQQQIADAQVAVDYWNGVKAEQDKRIIEERERQRQIDAANHEAAVEAEQQRQAEELAKREEQEQRGANAVHPAIRDKWNNAPKIDGVENEITLANGERVKGHYVLVESGAATPSHNPNQEFARNEGFPVDENGQTVNDRDYERDKEAQNITRQTGASYDSRAIQSVPVVSKDGVVLSGNGRTMAGELAAQNNTDGAYIEHLKKYPQQFGFTTEQVEGMQHPRVLFVADEDMPYTTETFAKFNAQDMKSQNRTEQSVKLGKTVDDATFNRVIKSINSFDSINDFYNDPTASTEAIGELLNAGAINSMQYGEMFDGDKVSEVGRQMLENMLIGKAFESNPDAIRQLSEFPSLRQSVISALAEITNNIKLGADYSVEDELAQAINLAYQARKNGTKAGDRVSWYARQLNLFQFDDGETVADYTNATVLMLADVINDSRVGMLKKTLALYNHAAADSAAGQMDIFSGGVKSKQDIIKEVLNTLNYGTELEQQAALDAAREQRKAAAAEPEPSGGNESIQQDGTDGAGRTGSEEATVVAEEQPVLAEAPAAIEPNEVQTAVAAAEAETNVAPTDAQKKAGNYKKGHVKIDSFDVTIENPKGSERSGTDGDGKKWSITMNNTYGYIRGTEGVDGDHIDVFFSEDPSQGDVFVVDQVNKDGSFDEHKVMYGFPDIESARKAYLSNYEEGWQGLGAITPVSKEEFKKWIDSSHRKTKPFSEYSSVKPLGDTQLGEQKPSVVIQEGEDYVTMAERIASTSAETLSEADKKARVEQQEIGGAMVDRLESMGFEVSTDPSENRHVRKAAEKDNSEEGKLRHFATPDGKIYGFTYKGKMYLDPRKIDAELPIHEYAHPWCEAFRRLNPEGWKSIVDLMKGDKDTWDFVKQLNPDLTSEDDIAEEMIAKFSGQRGAERAKAEYERMNGKDPDYKSKWGNIWQNISKAIQDFWKQIGDFLQIKYKSTEQVYDQVVRDFANRINPRKRVEQYLQERDDAYMEAAVSGDKDKVREIFDEALRENIGNGITPFVAVGGYRGKLQKLAHGVKTRDAKVIAEVADLMAPMIPRDAVLVPAPSHSGKATDMLDLAQAISERTGVPVADVLTSGERGSQYEAKKAGKPIASGDMGIVVSGELPADKIPVVIDNVVDTGNTAEACVKALGKGLVVSLADSADRYKHVASLKSAEPVVMDRDGNVVPLSKRFELGGRYLEKSQSREEENTPTESPVNLSDIAFDANIVSMSHLDNNGYNLNTPMGQKLSRLKKEAGENGLVGYTDSSTGDYVFLGNDADVINRSISLKTKVLGLQDGMSMLRVPERDFDIVTPTLVKNGHKLAITDDKTDLLDDLTSVAQKKVDAADKEEADVTIEDYLKANPKDSADEQVRKRATKALLTALDDAGVPYKVVTAKEERQMLSVFSQMNVEAIKEFARNPHIRNTSPHGRGRYIVYNMENPFGVPMYAEKKSVAKWILDGMKKYDGKWQILDIGEPGQEAQQSDGLRNAVDMQAQIGYHGSGAEFDAFDHSHMGEGEGNQTYGWGTYITEVVDIGRMYAQPKFSDQGSYSQYKSDKQWLEDNDTYEKYLANNKERTERVVEYLQRNLDASTDPDIKKFYAEEIDKANEKISEPFYQQEYSKILGVFQRKYRPGYLYKVEIPEDNGDNYFDWTQTVPAERTDKILAELRKRLLADEQYGWNTPDGIKRLDDELEAMKSFFGGAFYSQMSVLLGNSVAGARIRGKRMASELLHDLGYVGIKYPAEFMSGGREDGATNHVIFKEDDAKIVGHVQFMLDKENGGIYGWTDGKQIFLTKRGLNPNSPLHEYTHIWASYMEKHNPELWSDIVKTMKQTDMWQQIRQNSNYRSIWENENKMASEVLSRLSGATGEEEFTQAATGNKKNSRDIIKSVKSALKKFWESVVRLFSGRSKTEARPTSSYQAIVRMPLKDLLEGFNPIETDGETSGTSAVMPQRGNVVERTLMGVHNITEEKLRKAIKQGGLANPSLAVIDTKNGMHSDYGEISLIPRSSLIDSKTGRNAGTFAGDAWTPTYPQVEKQMSDKGRDAYYKDVNGVSEDRSLTGELKMIWDNYLEGRDPDNLAYWFFKEQGIEPEKIFFESGYTEEQRKRYAELTDNGRKKFEEMTDDERAGVIAMMAEQDGISVEEKLTKYQMLRERNAELLAKEDTKPFRKVSLRRTIDEIDKYGISLSPVSEFLYGMKRALENDGKLNVGGTLTKARDKMQADGLYTDFKRWLEEKEQKYGVKEMLFDGYTRDGDRKYIPNTIENASRMMNRQAEANAGDQTGFGASRAMLLGKMYSLADIRKHKGKLKGIDEDSEQRYQAASDEMFQIVNALSDMQKISDNPFSNVDYANMRLNEALTKKDPIGYLNREYGYDISKDGEFAKGLSAMLQTLENLPVKYFETKFRRPVGLDEFAVAVVPESTSTEVVDALRNAGLDVRTYDNSVYDTADENRTMATMEAVQSRNDIMFQIESAAATDDAVYRLREDAPPAKTGVGYKVFVLKDGKLYPPMVANPNGAATPVGVWLDADAAPVAGTSKTGRQQVKAGGKGTQGGSGKLAYRPGWHLGTIPYALQFNRLNPETGQRELFPANFVWAEVEYANDVDYQKEAMSYGMNANGKFQHSLAGLPRLPENGSYMYRTNPDPKTDPWVITGAMKVNRILKPSEVDAMVEDAGREPQQRQAGAITDEQVDALNREVQRTMKSDRDMMRTTAEQMGAKLNTRMNIIEDVNDITHPNKEIEARRRRSKGWFDTATGEVVIVLPNNRDVEDVAATIGHETVAHKGLRELVGEDNYNNFLDETYKHLRDDLKKGVDDAAGRAFIDDATKNGKSSKSYEEHRRTATDELFGRMAEKPFEEFSEGERTLWQKMCHVIRRLLDKFLGTLKLPKWFTLGDNEIRYILWRSKERLERGREDYVDMARDVVKREELGLTDAARYNMGDVAEPSFASRRDRAVNERGYVHAGLNSAEVKVVSIKEKSPFDTSKKTKVLKEDVVAYANEHNIIGTMSEDETKGKGQISISKTSIEKMVDDSATSKSVDKDTHLAVIPQLREIIAESMMAETHPDYNKGEDGKRSPENGYNPDNLIHRCYGAISVDGQEYRVKLTLKETSGNRKSKKAYSYEVTKIEVLDGQTTKPLSVSSRKSNTPNGTDGLNSELEASSAVAKLLQNVEKSYEKGKNLLAESKKTDEDTAFYRDGDETGDIWSDQSMGLQERMTAAATRLANNHRDNKTLRNDAMRAIGGNLADLRRAMSLQRTFDMTTVKRVADLARVLMDGGYLNGLTQQEVKRLLAAVKNSVGHEDIESSVQKVMDIMVDNQLKHAEETLHSLESIRGSKVDARGVEVIGQLDPAGAHTMQVFKKARGWEKTDIEEAIADAQQRMGSSDTAVADEAALDYTGLQLAMDYAENIKDSKTDERKLRDEIKQAHDTTSERDRATDAYRQYIASLNEAIRQNKIERAQAYFDLVGRMSGSLRESIANAQDFKEAEKQRIREIQHNANSDMEGRPSDEHQMPANTRKKIVHLLDNSLFAPLATYMEMLRLFGRKSANGEGYLFNRFGRGWIDARQKEIRGVRDKYAILDAKAAEIFGGKVKTWGDLIRRVGKLPKGTVSFWNGGEMQEREMTQGNLMYIYMVNKMLDGRMKLRKMGITEENVADIEEVLDPRLIELADWLQDEFLVQTRNEYNETHKRMFGASMAAIEHYFPLRVLKNAIDVKAEDLDKPEVTDGISTITGSIIKRRRNSKPLDILNADALHVILSHVAEMEHWNAYAEFNRDLNTLRSYRRFRNQVQNMNTIYGNGKNLWEKFNDVCQMATGAYKPKGDSIEKAVLSVAQGVTAAKVSFRMFTALKQFASFPAYIPYVRADYLARALVRPDVSWSWCMEHLPIFEERWKSRVSGDPRLVKSILTAADWRQNLVVKIARAGMVPNAFVDALTVSMGAYAAYKTRKGQYLRDGYSEEQAERRAIQDAEIVYNETQQSGESAFTSTMQTDRTWWKVMFSIFRCASMAYQRQLHGALRDLGIVMKKGGVSERLAFMKKQMMRDGLSEAQADAASKRRLRRQFVKDGLSVATFGYIMQLAWNITGYLPYLLFGDDDETKDEFWDDIWTHTMGGWLEGLTGGDVMSLGIGMWLSGEVDEWKLKKEMPLTTDLYKTGREFFKGEYGAFVTDAVNLCVQIGLGVNPQSITDVALSIMDACGDDPTLAHEATICISRILQVPQSQIDKMYFDEVGLSGDEVSKYTPAQLAERYAQFKVKRGRFFSPWSWGDEERIKKFTDKANKTIKERAEQMGDDKVNEAYLQYEEVYKSVDAKVKAANKAGKTDYVKQAEMLDVVFADKDYETYETFKTLDKGLNDIVKKYLGSQSENEASLCRKSIVDYKKAMVGVLEAKDEKQSEQAWKKLDELSESFENQYWEIHDAATQ